MGARKMIGVVLIIAGIVIPLVSSFFCIGYEPEKGLMHNVYAVRIPLSPADKTGQSTGGPGGSWQDHLPQSVQLRFIVAFGVILVFVGVRRIMDVGRNGGEE